MRSHVVGFLLTFLFILSSCSTVPITGRRQLSLIPQSEMLSMSYQQYGDFLKSNQKRIDEISRLVPEVMQYYRKGQ